MASVSFRDVAKNFGAVSVLRGVSLEIEDGEFVVLVGPSGCGKSTLLRMLAGLEDISGGEIAIGDEVVNDLKPKERDIAMVFQSYALYPHLTVEQNMGFSLRIKKESKPVIEAAVAKAAGILGLEELLERYPRELSGGQRQRVAMGRAIVRDPEVFLFDEPLSNLDAKLRVQMRTEIKELHQRLRTTTVFVTHDQVEAMTMADRIVVMQNGSIEQMGSPLELYDRPANTFVAGFIGSPAMNMIEGELVGGSTPLVDAGTARFPVPAAPNASVGRRVIAGIRPEQFYRDDNGFAVRVTVVEPTGSEMYVQATLGGSPIAVVFRERHDLRPGDELRLGVAPDAIHLFDKATGLRLET